MAWMKPRSSIWSASSSTKISTLARLTARRFDQIDEPAGCGDEDVDAAVQGANLVVDRHAAENDRMREPQKAAIGAE